MSNKIKIFSLVPFFLVLLVPGGNKTVVRNPDNTKTVLKLEVGEELVYVVRYSVMRLGEVKVVVTGKEEIDGKDYYSAAVYIDSYPGIPFVNLHQVYETTMTPDYYSKYFKGILKHDNYDSSIRNIILII